MHPLEQAAIRAFIFPHRRARWLESLASPKRRAKFLDRLNHCRDFDERYVLSLPSNTNLVAALIARGAPAMCYIVSASRNLDGQELLLTEAAEEADLAGWGTLICCLPGELAYFYDECGERRLLLERKRAVVK